MMNWLKSRKRNGTIACREKVQTVENIVNPEDHRKVRMVKAKLLEPQFQGLNVRRRRSDV